MHEFTGISVTLYLQLDGGVHLIILAQKDLDGNGVITSAKEWQYSEHHRSHTDSYMHVTGLLVHHVKCQKTVQERENNGKLALHILLQHYII